MGQLILQTIEDAIEILEDRADEVTVQGIERLNNALQLLAIEYPDLRDAGYSKPVMLGGDRTLNQEGRTGEIIVLRSVTDIRKAESAELLRQSGIAIQQVIDGDKTQRDLAIRCLKGLKSNLTDRNSDAHCVVDLQTMTVSIDNGTPYPLTNSERRFVYRLWVDFKDGNPTPRKIVDKNRGCTVDHKYAADSLRGKIGKDLSKRLFVGRGRSGGYSLNPEVQITNSPKIGSYHPTGNY